jgi:hypothetical protein
VGQPADELAIWVKQQPRGAGQLGLRGALLKMGPQVAKIVTVADFGDRDSGALSKRELSFKTVPRRRGGSGYDFDSPSKRWACENEEVEKLLAFLHTEVATTGRYRIVDTNSPLAALLELAGSGQFDTSSLVEALAARSDLGNVVAALASTDEGLAAAEGAIISQRRELIANLREMAENPATTETDLQRRMGDAYWLFGGRYVGVAERRNIAPLDQHDIPLLGADGTLHVVELKGPNIPRLVRPYRNHYIVGTDVHEATSQAINYLRTLDETGAVLTTTYRNEYGVDYDMRRIFATVVIGHPAHVISVDGRTVEQTLRSYNAHLSRVEVITYATLLETAERALAFEDTARTQRQDGQRDVVPDNEHEPFAGAPHSPWDDEPPF